MSKAKLKSISKNLKKSSRVHAKQAKQLESIMKKSPTRKNGKVTGKNPSKKDAARRKSFCARSRSWKSERGLAARRRWRC